MKFTAELRPTKNPPTAKPKSVPLQNNDSDNHGHNHQPTTPLEIPLPPQSMPFHRPLRRTTITNILQPPRPQPPHQTRHASLLRRPKRPYSFTQLVTLSDGSTYTHRTTSPAAIYKTSKDTRNTALWNPSSQKLLNVEADEAGRLRAFRERFGRGWDAQTVGGEEARRGEGEEGEEEEEEESLLDLISGFGVGEGGADGVREGEERSGKGKGGKS